MKDMNTLYLGDNLEKLKKFPENYVDLIYLDPPFQSGRNYNICFETESKKKNGKSTAQQTAFTDTWKWGGEAEREYLGLLDGNITIESNPKLNQLMRAMYDYLGKNSLMAYLVMMAPRLMEMRRVMKETASIYLHCDPTASHYLKILMDSIFDYRNFRNEVVWLYEGRELSKKYYNKKHDILLFYTKSDKFTFNWESILEPLKESSIKSLSRYQDKNGNFFSIRYKKGGGFAPIEKEGPETYRQYLPKGVPPKDWFFTDYSRGRERCDFQNRKEGKDVMIRKDATYPTQKPEALLERIIKASSNEGDLVLDPFCGCGTTVAVSQRLKREWIGIDITYIAITIIKERLERSGYVSNKDFKLLGYPTDAHAAEILKKSDPEGYKKYMEFKSRPKKDYQSSILNEFGELAGIFKEKK